MNRAGSGRKGGAGLFAAFERLLAFRYLRPRRSAAFLSVIAGLSFIGIMLGVAMLIVVTGLMNGFRQELIDKILGVNGHIVVQPLGLPLEDYDRTVDEVETAPGVQAAIPLIDAQAFAIGDDGSSGVAVRGIRLADIKRMPAVYDSVVHGSLDGFENADEPGLMIGSGVARRLNVGIGDFISIFGAAGVQTPWGETSRQKDYPIKAIFKLGMSEFDSFIVFMPFAEAQLFFNMEESVSMLEVYVDDPDAIKDLRGGIASAISRPATVLDWTERNRTFFDALEIQRNVMFLVVLMIVLVAAFNIVSGLIMLVKDKSTDIAVLRTMGATRGAVMRIFFTTGAAIGTVGTFAGLLLGLWINGNVDNIRAFIRDNLGWDPFPAQVYFVDTLRAELSVSAVLAIVAMALGLSFLATLYPAWSAARLDPVRALRNE